MQMQSKACADSITVKYSLKDEQKLHKRNNRLSKSYNLVTCSIITLEPPPTQSLIQHTLFNIIPLGVDAV